MVSITESTAYKLNNMSDAEIYKQAKSHRDALMKRYRRLKDNALNNPGDYSPFGLKTLEKEGIPMVSTSMSRRELKSTALRLDALMDMKTTTSRGAGLHQRETIKNMAGVPMQGRLNAEQQRKYNQYRDYIRQNPDRMTDFWEAFEHWKNEAGYRMLDSHRELEEFREFYDNLDETTRADPDALFAKIDEVIDAQYIAEQEKNKADRFGREDGFI